MTLNLTPGDRFDPDTVQSDISAAIDQIHPIFDKAPDAIRPYGGYQAVMELGVTACEKAITNAGVPPTELFNVFAGMTPEAFGNILLQWIGPFLVDDEQKAGHRYQITDEGKRAAIEVAAILGPDHAKTLLEFARRVHFETNV